MPTGNQQTLSPLWSGLIGAGAGMAGTAINAAWQGAMNKKTRKWNEKMYGRQREDALADWNRMNEFNSPAAQMGRFKEAGLNPNLIYGQSNEGATVRSAQVEGWNPKTSQVDGSVINQMFMMIYDLTKGNQEIMNLKAQEDLLKLDASLRSVSLDKSQLDLDTQRVLYGPTIRKGFADAYSQELHTDQQKLDIQGKKIENTIAEAAKNQSVAIALQKYNSFLLDQQEQKARIAKTDEERARISQEILNLKKMEKILSAENVIKQFQAKLTEGGSLPGDNAIFRAIQGTFKEIFERIGK